MMVKMAVSGGEGIFMMWYNKIVGETCFINRKYHNKYNVKPNYSDLYNLVV